MPICEVCGNEHNGNYGSGRFCSKSCKQKYVRLQASEEYEERNRAKLALAREKQAKSYNNYKNFHTEKVPNPNVPKDKARFGKLGEMKVVAKLLERGIPTYLPVTEAEEADIVAEFGGKLQKIQVKSSNSINNGQSVMFELQNTSNRLVDGKLIHGKTNYSKQNVDYFALYSAPDDRVFLLKNSGNRTRIHITDHPIPHQSSANLHFSKDYDIDSVLELIEAGIDPDSVITLEESKFTSEDSHYNDEEDVDSISSFYNE